MTFVKEVGNLFFLLIVITIFKYLPICLNYQINDENSVDVGRNISLVIVADQSDLGYEYDNVMTTIKKFVRKIKKQYLVQGTLKVKYWKWNRNYAIGDISIILTIGKCSDTWKLFNELRQNDLLFITITDFLCPRLPFSEAITLPLVEPGQELPQFLLDLRTSNAINWRTVSVLYDKSLAEDEVEDIVESLTQEVPNGENTMSSLVTLHRINDFDSEWKRHTNLENIIKNFTQFEKHKNLLIIVEYEMVSAVLDIAKLAKLLRPTVQCLFVVRDVDLSFNFSSFVPELDEGENIAFAYNTTVRTSSSSSVCYGGLLCHVRELMNNLGLALEKSVGDELELSKQVSDEEWDAIKPTKIDRRNTLLNFILSKTRNGGICDNCTRWKLAAGEVWGQDYLDARVQDLLNVGSWNPREGPVLLDELFPHSKHGFRSRSLPIATFHFPPWQILYFNETGHVTQYKGLVFEIINLLARNLNFTYNVVVPTNTTLSGFTNSTKYLEHSLETLEGKQDESALRNVWNKVIDVVKHKKVFLGACAFTVTDARKSIINFTLPIGHEPYVFLLSRPKELSRALLFMSPFTANTWCCIVAAVALMTPVLCAISRYSPFYNAHASKKNGGFNSPMTCFWYIYGALLQQGGGALPAADSSRLVIGTWWLVVLVVVTTYSGNLVAFLTFPKMDKLITNVDELLLRKDYVTWGIPANSTLENLLKESDDPKLSMLYKMAKLHPTISKELIASVRDGLHVYIQRKTSLLFVMKQEFLATNSCQFALGNEEFLSEHLAMAIAQDSPYLEIINREIKWMHRVGLINKWLQEYLPKKDKCSSFTTLNEVTNHKVNLNDMQGSFFVLFLGFIISLFLIIVEYLVKKRASLKEKRVIQPFVS